MKYKIIIVAILILLGNQKTFSQNSSIKGKCIEYKTSDLMPGVSINFHTHSGKEYLASTNNDGIFELKIGDDLGNLIVSFIGCYGIKLLNIPQGLKHIDLGEIKIVELDGRFQFDMKGCAVVLSEEQIERDKKWRKDILEKYRIKVLEKELKPYFEGRYLVFDFNINE